MSGIDLRIQNNKERVVQPKVKSHLKDAFTLLFKKHPKLKPYYKYMYFAGGCIRSLLQKETPKDYDIFLTSPVAIAGIDLICRDNKIGQRTLNSVTIKVEKLEFQIIMITHGQPRAEVDAFDFTFNMNYYYPAVEKEKVGYDTFYVKDMDAILSKQLKVNYDCRNSFDTFFRLFKFMDRGYTLGSQDELRKIAVRLTQINAIKDKQGFLDNTRMCGSTMLETGNLEFLE